jgi:hypothetical protein
LEACTSFRAADSTQAAAILIGLGFVSSFFGMTILSTPSLYSAVTLSPLTAADLDAFSYASVDDVRLCDLNDGFTLAVLGVVPERRLLLESMHGALTMKNGVPIGYVLFSSLFEWTEVAFNVFDTFRGAEAAHVLSRVLAVGHRLFGARTFSIDPYQLGHFGNAESTRPA